MPITRRNKRSRIAAFDLEEQELTPTKQADGAHAKKSKYVSCRNKLLDILKPGDHIAAKRKKGLYEHHGIFEGIEDRGYPSVIHFKNQTKSPAKKSRSPHCTFNCGYEPPEKGGTAISCIDCFSKEKEMFKMQYMLQDGLLSCQDQVLNHLEPGKVIAGYRSKKYYLEHKLGAELYGHSRVSIKKVSEVTIEDRLRYYPVSSDRSPNQVLEAARLSKFSPYSLLRNNCEHFAVFSKTGSSRCIQIEKVLSPIVGKKRRSLDSLGAKVVADAENESQNLFKEEVGSSEPLLRRSLGVKRRKTCLF